MLSIINILIKYEFRPTNNLINMTCSDEFTIYDIYSMTPIVYGLYGLIIFDYKILVGFLCCELITKYTKLASNHISDKTSLLYKLSRRPITNECTKCDLFNSKIYAKDTPGFPSGHMAYTVFFFSYMLLKHSNTYFNAFKTNKVILLIYTLCVFLMGIARYKKGCHTILQIFGGSFIGYILGNIVVFL